MSVQSESSAPTTTATTPTTTVASPTTTVASPTTIATTPTTIATTPTTIATTPTTIATTPGADEAFLISLDPTVVYDSIDMCQRQGAFGVVVSATSSETGETMTIQAPEDSEGMIVVGDSSEMTTMTVATDLQRLAVAAALGREVPSDILTTTVGGVTVAVNC